VESQIIVYGIYARTITPYISINGGGLQQTANANLLVNDSITLSPQCGTGGLWSWSGPNGFTAATRQITINNIHPDQAGTYTATYTNSYGTQSTRAHVINVSYWTPILNDGFEAGGTFTINGWVASLEAKWIVNSIDGNPTRFAYGGGSSTVQADLNSGIISKNTGYVIQGNEIFNLTFDIKRMAVGNFDGAILALLFYYADDSSKQILGSVECHEDLFPALGWYADAGNVSAIATDASIGKTLYVSFEGGPSSWNGLSAQRLGVDNVFIRKAVFCDRTDMNFDTQVDIADLVMFCQAWLSTSPDESVDLWPDNIITLNDFLFFSNCWNR
jgi:hypothetical protein